MDKPKLEKHIIILNESVIGSLIKDVGTFALFGSLLWFNHAYLNGNGWLDFLFILIVIMWLQGRNSGRVYSGDVAGALKWLETKRDATDS